MADKTQDTNQKHRLSPEAFRKAGALAEKEAKIIELIVFKLGDEEFAANIDQVREIMRIGTITPIPDSPDFIEGVTNVRGEITVAIDLKARLFLPVKQEVESKHIVITEQEKNLFGLMVDEVTEVLRISESEVKPTPELVTRIDRIYIRGVITLEKRLIILIDLAKVLQEEELTKLAKLSERHRSVKEAKERKAKPEEAPETKIAQEETAESSGHRAAEKTKEQGAKKKETSKTQNTQKGMAESADEKKKAAKKRMKN